MLAKEQIGRRVNLYHLQKISLHLSLVRHLRLLFSHPRAGGDDMLIVSLLYLVLFQAIPAAFAFSMVI